MLGSRLFIKRVPELLLQTSHWVRSQQNWIKIQLNGHNTIKFPTQLTTNNSTRTTKTEIKETACKSIMLLLLRPTKSVRYSTCFHFWNCSERIIRSFSYIACITRCTHGKRDIHTTTNNTLLCWSFCLHIRPWSTDCIALISRFILSVVRISFSCNTIIIIILYGPLEGSIIHICIFLSWKYASIFI